MTDWAPPIPKVTALITRPGPAGPELLVFDHGLAGTQLPAGTVEEGESFETGVLREGWEETGALGLELVRELAVTRRRFAGRAGAIVCDVLADGRPYRRGNLLNILRVDGNEAVTELWDGTPLELATNLIARSEERHVFHLRATVEMPDEWLVVTPDGGGVVWTCFWATIDEAHETIHEYQRDWLDAARPLLDQSAQEAPPTRPRSPLPAAFEEEVVFEHFIAPPADRRFALSYVDDCDEEACSRATAFASPRMGRSCSSRKATASGAFRAAARRRVRARRRTSREKFGRRCARVIESRFLTALRIVELDEERRPDRPRRVPRADVGASSSSHTSRSSRSPSAGS